ncbi:MAG: lipopolysaccharide kinase InaA family protein, partial [Myxococcota bacterium]
MSDALDWLEGDEPVRARIDEWWASMDSRKIDSREIARSIHRSLIRLGDTPEAGLVIKRFHAGNGLDRFFSLAKAVIRRSAWQREWRALTALWAAGVAVPEPLGLARTAGGDRLVVSAFIEGVSLWDELRNAGAASNSRLEACGRAVACLHGAGVAHGDLHPGNLLLAATGPVLIDFQRSAKLRRRTRIGDIARLDFSLARSELSDSQRGSLIREALGPATEARDERQVRARSRRLAVVHRRTRLRQSLRPGDGRVALRTGGHVGLRRVEFEEETLRAILAAYNRSSAERATPRSASSRHGEHLIQSGGRFYRVCEDQPRTFFSRLGPSLFGSTARRAWQQAHDPQRWPSADRVLAFCE